MICRANVLRSRHKGPLPLLLALPAVLPDVRLGGARHAEAIDSGLWPARGWRLGARCGVNVKDVHGRAPVL